ncbi:MAG TPA: dTDP-glucose 4,6-dehydratase [Anaerolineaceae bacterium]|nr:dTDP-glucose 4,6-dehydratase [Anaerolineaceae bacterium]
MLKTILVTGGAGFIGSNFIRFVLTEKPDATVINLDLLTYAGSLENLRDLPSADRYTFVKGDICEQEKVANILRERNVDTIVNFAAESHVDRSIHSPGVFIQTNIFGTFSLLEAARKVWLEENKQGQQDVRFHHISTDEVYGSLEPGDPAFQESNPYSPNSPYAASKASSDHLVNAYVHTYGLPATITNCSNNYGPYQFPEKLIPLIILNAVDGKPLPVYGDGKQVRDWLYVEDHCKAIWAVLEKGMVGESYNIGGENQPTNLEIIHTICSILDEKIPNLPYTPHKQLITFVTDRPGHDRRYAMNIDKIRTELGWTPDNELRKGLYATVEWYLKNKEWIKRIHEKPTYQDWLDENYSKRG